MAKRSKEQRDRDRARQQSRRISTVAQLQGLIAKGGTPARMAEWQKQLAILEKRVGRRREIEVASDPKWQAQTAQAEEDVAREAKAVLKDLPAWTVALKAEAQARGLDCLVSCDGNKDEDVVVSFRKGGTALLHYWPCYGNGLNLVAMTKEKIPSRRLAIANAALIWEWMTGPHYRPKRDSPPPPERQKGEREIDARRRLFRGHKGKPGWNK